MGAKGLGRRPTTEYKGQRQVLPPQQLHGKGPIGAGGTRPLLGGRGGDPLGGKAGRTCGKGSAAVPITGGKGPTLDARGFPGKADDWGKAGHSGMGKGTTTAGLGGTGNDGGTKGMGDSNLWGTSWTRPPTVLDEDGYELVQPRRIRAGKGGPKGGDGATAATGGLDQRTYAAVARRRWSDDNDSDADDAEDQEDADEANGHGDGDGGNAGTDPAALRAAFEVHAKAARELERKGNFGPALATLQAARDEAERRWREAKPPAPLSKRLEWADGKLRRAQAALTRARQELDAFDEDVDRRRAEICERIQVAEQWYQWRKQQLDDVHEEAAECAPGRRGGASGVGGEGTKEIRRRIRAQMLPEMQAILEEVPEGSGLHERLSLFAAGLADAEANLGEWQSQECPTTYHMDDDDTHDDWSEGAHDDAEGMEDHERGAEEGARTGGAGGWRSEGASRWTRADTQRAGDQRQRLDAAAAGDMGGPTQGGAAQGTGSASAEAAAGGGGASTVRVAECAETDEGESARAGKHRRCHTSADREQEERAAADTRRADELRRQLAQATAAQERSFQEGKGGFGSQAALSAAAQGFVLQVQKAQTRASEMGVEPVTKDGRTLLELSPAELAQWESDNLAGGQMRD